MVLSTGYGGAMGIVMVEKSLVGEGNPRSKTTEGRPSKTLEILNFIELVLATLETSIIYFNLKVPKLQRQNSPHLKQILEDQT